MNDPVQEAASLIEYWRKLYVRTGIIQYHRTAEALAALRAIAIEAKTATHVNEKEIANHKHDFA